MIGKAPGLLGKTRLRLQLADQIHHVAVQAMSLQASFDGDEIEY